MKAKRLLAILAIPTIVGVLASCGKGDSETTKPVEDLTTTETDKPTTTTEEDKPTKNIIGEPTEIVFWHCMGKERESLVKQYVETFKEIEPNVTVTVATQGTDYTTLKDAIVKSFSTGQNPDIAQAYPDHVADYLNYGYATKLDEFMTEHPLLDEEDYIPGYMEEGTQYISEGTYSLPFQKSTEVLMYNATVLHGLSLATIDSTINEGKPLNAKYLKNLTWEEFFGKLAPALMRYDTEVQKIILGESAYKSVLGYDSDDNLFVTYLEQYGYGYTAINDGEPEILYNNAKAHKAMKDFNDYKNKKYIITKGGAEGQYTSNMFKDQSVLFTVGSTGGLTYNVGSFELGVGIPMQPAQGTKRMMSQGPSIAILGNQNVEDKTEEAARKELASYLFYRHLTNYENSLDWAIHSGYFGIRNSIFESDEYLDANDPSSLTNPTKEWLIAKVNSEANSFGDKLFTTPAFKGSATARTQGGGLITKAMTHTGELTIPTIEEWFSEAMANVIADM